MKIMNVIRGCLLVVPLVAASTGAYAGTNLSGNYLITLSGNPSNGGPDSSTACVTLNEDGSTLNYGNSGSLTLTDTSGSYTGFWFTRSKGAIFIVSMPNGLMAFSGVLGGPTIVGTAFIQVVNSAPTAGGTFTAKKNGC